MKILRYTLIFLLPIVFNWTHYKDMNLNDLTVGLPLFIFALYRQLLRFLLPGALSLVAKNWAAWLMCCEKWHLLILRRHRSNASSSLNLVNFGHLADLCYCYCLFDFYSLTARKHSDTVHTAERELTKTNLWTKLGGFTLILTCFCVFAERKHWTATAIWMSSSKSNLLNIIYFLSLTFDIVNKTELENNNWYNFIWKCLITLFEFNQ